MSRGFYRGVAGSRGRPWPRDARVAWRGWLTAGRDQAGLALAGAAQDKTVEVELAEGALRGARTPYPVEDAPAQGMARAWGELARTFIATSGTERRAQIARPLAMLSTTLEQLLDEAGLAAAARSRAIIGEKDE